MHGIYFNILFFKRFWKLLKILFPRCLCANALLFVCLLSVVLLEQVVIYQVGMLPSKFYLVLGERDMDGFRETILYALILIVSIAFILATEKYVCGVFYVTSREMITSHLHQGYFKGIKFYYLNVLSNSIDNPDQRITQDVDRTCKQFSTIIAQLLISPFIIAYYTYTTWMVTGYMGPLFVVIFFMVSTIVNKFLMSPVASLVYQQERLEGDFRFKHMQVRSNAEPAAFFRSGKIEQDKTNLKLTKLVATQHKLLLKEYALNFSVNMADYLGSILSYVIIAIPIFGGKYDDLTPTELSALISQVAFVTIYLISCFTKLIDMSLTAADMAGTTHRVCQLIEALNEPDELDESYDQSGISSPAYVDSDENVRRDETAFVLENVTYCPPNSKQLILVKNLDLEVHKGTNLLITGDSGCGKSSLIRVLGRLWPHSKGQVKRLVVHGHMGVMYLPQRPMLTDGTLREQIIYPFLENGHHGVDDKEILDFLHDADLMNLLSRIGGLDVPVDWNWYDQLSPGEMQRLSFVRLFYHHPPFAVLDEATSQVGAGMEEKLYMKCKTLQLTVVSIGHRYSLRKFHDEELRITGKGEWLYEQISV